MYNPLKGRELRFSVSPKRIENMCFNGRNDVLQDSDQNPTLNSESPGCKQNTFSLPEEKDCLPMMTPRPTGTPPRSYPEKYECVETKRQRMVVRPLHELIPRFNFYHPFPKY